MQGPLISTFTNQKKKKIWRVDQRRRGAHLFFFYLSSLAFFFFFLSSLVWFGPAEALSPSIGHYIR